MKLNYFGLVGGCIVSCAMALPHGGMPSNLPVERTFTQGADKPSLDFVRDMMSHAWHNYRKYAWGHDYLRPISKTGFDHHASPFTSFTIVDALDTLKLMGLDKEFQQGRDYIATITDKNYDIDVDISFFETTIRVVGGLLAAYDLSGDYVFVEKAKLLADRLIPAFETPTGMPDNSINLKSGAHRVVGDWLGKGKLPIYHDQRDWKYFASDEKHYGNIAEIGSNILELTRLSQLTNMTIYEEVARGALTALEYVVGPDLKVPGLYPVWISTADGSIKDAEDPEYSLGACADSFYEYLLKMWILSGKSDHQSGDMFDKASAALKKHLLKKNKEGLLYFPVGRLEKMNTEMQHLTCFAGGMYALSVITGKSKDPEEDTKVAAGITDTCYEMYYRQTIGLSPENVDMRSKSMHSHSPYYAQRPEVIESIFYMWRITHDSKYREWAWNIAQSIERNTKLTFGYSGIKDIYDDYDLEYNDVQDSFFLAETLKYLYVIFEKDEFIDLEKWVFNTEAHLLKAVPLTPKQETTVEEVEEEPAQESEEL